jgi:acetyltransferase
MGTIQMLNLVNCGFPGDIMPVHPTEKTVLGKKAYPSIKDLPYAPDLAIFVVPTRLVPEMLEDIGKLGTKHAVIITAGFRETGGKGRDLEKRIIDIARTYGIRFLGPNCLGIVNTHLPLNITVAPILVHGGSFSLASQSGTYIAQSVKFLQKNGIGFAKAISVGNEADISLADCLEYLGDDDRTKAIGLYIEGIRDGARFLEVARRVSVKKPIVAQYVGGTEAGARSGSSHTGAMAGPDFIYDGLFAQAGIIRVDTIEEVYRIGWALATQPPLKGTRIAVLTNSGGPGTAIASTCNAANLEIPEFSPGIQESISELIPGHASPRNPVDLTFHMDMDTLAEKIPEILFQASEIDGIIIHGIMDTGFLELMYPVAKDYIPMSKEEFLKASQVRIDKLVRMPHTYGKPLLISSFFGKEDHAIDEFHGSRVPTFDSPEKAAKAMAAFYKHLLIRKRNSSGKAERPEMTVPAEAREILDGRKASAIDEYMAKRVLRAYGIPTAQEHLARSPEEAIESARRIGFPVAVKACSPSISHKTEQNLVFLNVNDEDGVRQACDSILSAAPDAGILVAEMLRGKREFMAGISTYAGFPPCVMFGLGGIFAEALKDFTIRLAPLSRDDALEMIGSIGAKALIGPYRSMGEVDRNALASVLMRLGDLALDFPGIKEIDLNPVIIEDGKPKVADALMIIR